MARFFAGFATCSLLVLLLVCADDWHSFYRLTWSEQMAIRHARKMARPLIIVAGHRKDLPAHLPIDGQSFSSGESEVWACGWRDKEKADAQRAKLRSALDW